VHATAYYPRHVDPLPSACLPCLSYNLCCVDKGPRQGVHAQVHSYTPTGKGRVLRGAFLSTTHTGTGTDSGEGSAKEYAVGFQIVAGVLGVATFTAYAVHNYEQDKAATEINRIEGERATEMKLAAMEIARVEGDRKLAKDNLKAEVARYKQDVVLAYSEDYNPYREAIRKKKTVGTWWSWLFG